MQDNYYNIVILYLFSLQYSNDTDFYVMFNNYVLDIHSVLDHDRPWTKHVTVSYMKYGVTRMNVCFV
jgi:hypothetical protein